MAYRLIIHHHFFSQQPLSTSYKDYLYERQRHGGTSLIETIMNNYFIPLPLP